MTLDEAIEAVVDLPIDEESAQLAHWVAAPIKDVGTFEQFHEVVDRALAIIDLMRAREKVASDGGKNAGNNNG